MKFLNYALMLLILAFWSCDTGDKTTGNTAEPDEKSKPVQWVTYEGKDGPGAGKRIVLVSGDEEYRSEEALPQMAKILSEHHGFDCTVLFAQNPEKPGLIDPNYVKNIPGLEALEEADLMILFTRFRELPNEQMQHFENYLQKGKPLIAIRTATHAFRFQDSTHAWRHYGNYYKGEKTEWEDGFGRLVLGERWHTHHGHHKHQSTRGLIAPGATEHPITTGLEDGDIWGPTDVYGIRLPLPGDAKHLILGQVINRAGEFDEDDPFYGMKPTDSEVATVNPATEKPYNPNDPMMPVAWIKSYQIPGGQTGQAFTSTTGSSTDMASAGVRRLFVNASYYLLGMRVPVDANVAIVGTYQPSAYQFQDDEHWTNKSLKVSDYLPEGEQ